MHDKFPPQTTASLVSYSQLTPFSYIVPAEAMAKLEEELASYKRMAMLMGAKDEAK